MFALVDGNKIYVSCERVFRPSLNGRPVIVLSNNDGCAIARSNEAKDLGIKMGAPWFQIRHLEVTAGLVALSANAMPEAVARARASGFDDYWTKPMVPELLVERVLKVLSRKLQSVGPVKREWRQGDVLIRLANEGAITRSGVTLKLNREETQFLALLLEKPGAYVSSAELKRVIWQNHVIESALRIMVFRLRKRLVNIGLSAEAVVGHRDRGYRIDLDAFEEGGA